MTTEVCCSIMWNQVSVLIQVCVCCTCQSEEAPLVSVLHCSRQEEASSTRAWTVTHTFTRPFSSRMWWGRHSLSWETRVRGKEGWRRREQERKRGKKKRCRGRNKDRRAAQDLDNSVYECEVCFCKCSYMYNDWIPWARGLHRSISLYLTQKGPVTFLLKPNNMGLYGRSFLTLGAVCVATLSQHKGPLASFFGAFKLYCSLHKYLNLLLLLVESQ